jgi:xanthine dehydrogenase accessory factor
MRDWLDALDAASARGRPAVLVTVVATRGSVPRMPGTRMLVTADGTTGTIGGGHLEFKATGIARDLLVHASPIARHRFALGASLGQCCGGVAQLLFEPVRSRAPWVDALLRARAESLDCALVAPLAGDAPDGRLVITTAWRAGTLGSAARDAEAGARARELLAGAAGPALCALDGAGDAARGEYFVDVIRQPDFRIVLFGAGHVGRALIDVLARLHCRIVWVDARENAFPPEVPANVERIATDGAARRVFSGDDAQPSAGRGAGRAHTRARGFRVLRAHRLAVQAAPVRASARGPRDAGAEPGGDDLPDRHRRDRGQGTRSDRHRRRRRAVAGAQPQGARAGRTELAARVNARDAGRSRAASGRARGGR